MSDGLPARRSLTYLIRNTQQELVAVNNQADVKASIIITAAPSSWGSPPATCTTRRCGGAW